MRGRQIPLAPLIHVMNNAPSCGCVSNLVLLSAGQVRATVLVDRFVAGAWKIEREKKAAALVIEMFCAVKKGLLETEGEALLRVAAPEVSSYAIQLKV